MDTEKKDILILAIESSCDETAAAVVKNGRQVLSNVISSQIDLHKLYGGVVPEIASRKHIEKINQVIEEALENAEVTLDDIDAIGVTYGPGLVGALLVGVAEAKAIAYAKKLPLVGVHHIEGHISANYIENLELEPPFLCLSIAGLPLMLKHRIFVLWSVSPVAKLAILFSTIQLHPCPQHQSPWRTLSCFQVYFFLVRLPVAVGLDDEYPLSFLIHCRQHPSS